MPSPQGPDPRRFVLRALARLDRTPGGAGQSILRAVLDGPDARDLDPRDRGLITECFYGVLRWRLRLDAAIGRHARKGVPKDPEMANVLRLGAFQLLFLDRVPARAAIHTSVRLAKRLRGPGVGGFVNGVLRAIQRQEVGTVPATLAERYAHPQWMVDRFRDAVGPERLARRLEANVTAPPVTLRLHPRASLGDLPVVRSSEHVQGLVTIEGDATLVRAGIRDGRWLPQDEASARVVALLGPTSGERVLELCCGRGVKTTQLATSVGPLGEVISVDTNVSRLGSAARLLARWAPDTPCRFLCADATRPLPLRERLRFDRILIDAPCSGLGVIRRRPETLWRRSPDDIAQLAGLQRQILEEAIRWLRPGGVLVYAVCTTTPEETTEVVAGRPVDRMFQTSPEEDGSDGFFAARMVLFPKSHPTG